MGWAGGLIIVALLCIGVCAITLWIEARRSKPVIQEKPQSDHRIYSVGRDVKGKLL
jgi:hypothetical protein